MAEVKDIMDAAQQKMEMSVMYLDEALATIRAGKASARLLDSVKVDYYGSSVPVSQVATIVIPDAKTIMIQPWEKSMLKEIEKAVQNSSIGITPENNGEHIRLGIPPITEDRRRDLVKRAKQEAETAKVSVRNARRDAIEALKKAQKDGMPEDMAKDGEDRVQKLHDKYIKKVEEVFAAKEKEILTV